MEIDIAHANAVRNRNSSTAIIRLHGLCWTLRYSFIYTSSDIRKAFFFKAILGAHLTCGRVLRAILSTQQPFRRTTQIDAHSGKGVAILFGFTGLAYNSFLTAPHRTITCSSAMG